jgi:hypothetical protein
LLPHPRERETPFVPVHRHRRRADTQLEDELAAPAGDDPLERRANVEPLVGCPAIGSSSPGVKIRMRTSPEPSRGKMNVLSEKFISRAIVCIKSVVRPSGSGNTASWLPSNGVDVNTSRWR